MEKQTRQPRKRDQFGPVADKQAVVSVMQRGGKVYSRHVERVTADNLIDVINSVCAEDAHLITDTGVLRHQQTGRKQHSLVNHTADEYVRYEEGFCVTTNRLAHNAETNYDKRNLPEIKPEGGL